jgi:hypothetical protein
MQSISTENDLVFLHNENHEKFWRLGTLACLQRASKGSKKTSTKSTVFLGDVISGCAIHRGFLKSFEALCRQANVPNCQNFSWLSLQFPGIFGR